MDATLSESLCLLVDTSGPETSVALAALGGEAGTQDRMLAERTDTRPMRHTECLLPCVTAMLESLGLDLKSIDAVSVAAGPGSYTALRSGLSFAKGLCMARELPLIMVPNLEALAYSGALNERREAAPREAPVRTWVAMRAARRDEAYVQVFGESPTHRLLSAREPAGVARIDTDWTRQLEDRYGNEGALRFVGDATRLVQEAGLGAFAKTVRLDAARAAQLLLSTGERWRERDFSELASSVPTYLRAPFITKAKPRL